MNDKEDSMITNPTKIQRDWPSLIAIGAISVLLVGIFFAVIFAVFGAEERVKREMTEESQLIQLCLTKPNSIAKFDKKNKYAGCLVGNGLVPQYTPDH